MNKHKKLKYQLKKIAKEIEVKVSFESCKYWVHGGHALVENNEIWVNPNNTIRNIISSFFHEIGHILDYRVGIYKNYYVGNLNDVKRLGLRAELHADKTGYWLCRKYFSKFRYSFSYRKKLDRDYLRSYYEEMLKY